MSHPKKKRRLQLAAAVRETYRQYDAEIAKDAYASEVTCSRGCSACCRMLVISSVPEALAIVSRYPREVERAKPALEADSAEMYKIAAARGVPPNVAHMMKPGMRLALSADWWALQRPCPFLTPAGECGVYDARPLACRSYHSRDNPEKCSRVPAGELALWIPGEQEKAMRTIAQAQFALTPEPGDKFACGVLAEVVLFARKQLRG